MLAGQEFAGQRGTRTRGKYNANRETGWDSLAQLPANFDSNRLILRAERGLPAKSYQASPAFVELRQISLDLAKCHWILSNLIGDFADKFRRAERTVLGSLNTNKLPFGSNL
jgi:hypothetical protein